MNKRLFLVFITLFFAVEVSAQTAFKYKREIDTHHIGMGLSNVTFMMNTESGYSQRIDNTRWRWGVSAGIMNPGMLDIEWELIDENTMVYSNYIYLLSYADYALTSGKNTAWFLRGGIAPAFQTDVWKYRHENKPSALAQFGIGLDIWRWFRVSWMGYVSIYGEVGYVMCYTLGWRWGK